MSNMAFYELAARLGVFFVPFLFALCFHEFAHGLVAKWRGDNTAEMQGRLTLNPFAHADPIGTWVLPIVSILMNSSFFFGWANPVPVNTRNFKHRLDMFWVAVAGPASNVLLALVTTVGLAYANVHFSTNNAVLFLLHSFLKTNLFLAAFNLIPVHPLDGGKIIEPFLPARWNIWLLENQSQLNMFLFVFLMLAGGILATPVLWAYLGLVDVANMIALRIG